MQEPDYLDLDAPSQSDTTPTRTSDQDAQDGQKPVGPSALLNRATDLGKAVLTAIHEERKDKVDRLKDRVHHLNISLDESIHLTPENFHIPKVIHGQGAFHDSMSQHSIPTLLYRYSIGYVWIPRIP